MSNSTLTNIKGTKVRKPADLTVTLNRSDLELGNGRTGHLDSC